MLKGFNKYIIKDFKNSNSGISEVIGTVLLLAMVISFFSVLYVTVLSHPLDSSEPNPNIVATVEGNKIILEHRGGDELSFETKITLEIGNDTISKKVKELLIDSNEDGKWNIGERLAFQFNYSLNLLEAGVTSIDVGENKIILLGTLDIHPESDIGLEVSVDNRFPVIGETVNLTIKAIHYRGDTTATSIQIEYLLPNQMTYINHTLTQGNYNNGKDIWYVGDLAVGESATITIRAKVSFLSEPTQLVMILDGSASIIKEDWTIMKDGLASAIKNSEYLPHDGSVELTVIQFGGVYSSNPNAKIEIEPIIVDITNQNDIASVIENIPQMKQGIYSWTPTACGIARAIDTIEKSLNFDTHRHVITLVTDGQPNAVYNIEDGDYRMEDGSWGNSTEHFKNGKISAVNARDYLLGKLNSKDEFDAIAVGGSGNYPVPDIDWLKDHIVWPNGYEWAPPFYQGSGWVRHVKSYEDVCDAIYEQFNIIFSVSEIVNTVKILDLDQIDPNAENDIISIIIIPYDEKYSN